MVADGGCPQEVTAFEIAAGRGHLEVVEYLHDNGWPRSALAFVDAAAGGHIAMIKYLHSLGGDWGLDALSIAVEVAAAGGHLEVVVFLVGYGYPYSAEVVFAAAVKFGWLEDIQYRILHGYLRSAPDFAEALNAYPELRQGGTDVCHVTRLHPVV